MTSGKDILSPVNTTDSPSPSIKRAAEEPANWRRQGDSATEAIANNPLKHPVDPATNK